MQKKETDTENVFCIILLQLSIFPAFSYAFQNKDSVFLGKNNKEEKVKRSLGPGKTIYDPNNETIIQPCFGFPKQRVNIQHPLQPTY